MSTVRPPVPFISFCRSQPAAARDSGAVPVVTAVFMLALLLLTAAPNASAQRQVGAFGAGGQAGLPGGATVKLYRDDSVAYDILFNTDLDDRFVLFAHRLWEEPIPQSPLWIYAGPGLVVGAENLSAEPVSVLGVSGLAGLNFYAERFEVFLQVMPRLQVHPSVRPRLGGSVGLRYYL